MRRSPKTDMLDGLSEKSREKAQKSVEKIASWEEAVVHTKVRIKELKQSLHVFQERVKRGEPWPA